MRRFIAILALCGTTTFAQQPPGPDVKAQREAMQKLEFMLGRWEGGGWIRRGPEKEDFTTTETVEARVNGLVTVIEGRHKSGESGFNALGVLSYDEAAKVYRFKTFTSEGRTADTELKLTGERTVEWGFTAGPGRVRYNIDMTEPATWVEVGEFSRDGTTWSKFFEMKLKKAK